MDREQFAKKESQIAVTNWNDIDNISYRELYRVFQELSIMNLEVLEDVREYLHAELNERVEDMAGPIGRFYSIYDKENKKMSIVHVTARDNHRNGWAGDRLTIEFRKSYTGETGFMSYNKDCTDGIILQDNDWRVEDGLFVPKSNPKGYEIKQISENYFLEVLKHIKALTTLRDELE